VSQSIEDNATNPHNTTNPQSYAGFFIAFFLRYPIGTQYNKQTSQQAQGAT